MGQGIGHEPLMSKPTGTRRCGTDGNGVDPQAPQGHALCEPCEPITVLLRAGSAVTITGAEVARLAGLSEPEGPRLRGTMARPGELSGACVQTSCYVSAETTGLSYPDLHKLKTNRRHWLYFVDGDAVRLFAGRDGEVKLWPMVKCAAAEAIER